MITPRTGRRRSVAASAGVLAMSGMFAFTLGSTAEAATVLTFSPLPQRMEEALQGSMCSGDNTCQKVDYSFSLPLSVDRITEAIAVAAATPEIGDPAVDEIVVFGLSGGAGASAQWMKKHAADVDAPSADRLSFVMIGNPGRKYGGSSRRFATTPETQYHVIDIARQYDPVADSPDDPFNLLAHLNVMAGILSPLHTDYSDVDINDPNNIRWTEGNTTYILVPTEKIPLLQPLRALGLTGLADALNGPLKEIIERGYNRPVPVPLSTVPPAEPEPATEVSNSTMSDPDDSPSETAPATTAGRVAATDMVAGGQSQQSTETTPDPGGAAEPETAEDARSDDLASTREEEQPLDEESDPEADSQLDDEDVAASLDEDDIAAADEVDTSSESDDQGTGEQDSSDESDDADSAVGAATSDAGSGEA